MHLTAFQRRAFAWIAVLAVSLALFADATEDVAHRNGPVLQDAARLRFFTAHRSDLLVHVAKVVTDFGGTFMLVAIALGAGVLLWRRGLPIAVAGAPLVALTSSAIIVAIIKHVIGRARPPVALHLVPVSNPSFPSGHAANSAALYVALALVLALYVFRRPIVRVLVVAGAALVTLAIGTSRLILGVHWPTDVVAGWALGCSVAVVVMLATTWSVRDRAPSPQPIRHH